MYHKKNNFLIRLLNLMFVFLFTAGLPVLSSAADLLPLTLVKDINAQPEDTNKGYCGGTPKFVTVGSVVFFCGEDFTGGQELWKSDGTTAGTVRVKDIIPGVQSSRPLELTEMNGMLYFTAETVGHGRELWQSDGTAGGTVEVADILSGVGTSLGNPRLTPVNGELFFVAFDGTGTHLWKSDGTPVGTQAVTTTDGPQNMVHLTAVDTNLFFAAKDVVNGPWQIWKSDGITTEKVLDVGATNQQPQNLTNVDGTLYFTAIDAGGRELWKSDGTPAGTARVMDIRPGGLSSSPTRLTFVDLTIAGPTLFFRANDGTNGEELWKSNAAGTARLIVSPGGSSLPDYLVESNGLLFFNALHRLWTSDGTSAGTEQVDAGAVPEAADPHYLTDINGVVYFSAHDTIPNNSELWSSDGTAANTVLVKEILAGPGGSGPQYMANVNNGDVLFTANVSSQSKRNIWVSDGTDVGTEEIKDMYPSTSNAQPEGLTVAAGKLFFSAYDGYHGQELWMTNGTEAGTTFFDINTGNQGTASSSPVYITAVNNKLFFRASDGATVGLWVTSGATPLRISDVYPSSGSSFGAVNSKLFYEAPTFGAHNGELWSSDGTSGGTQLVKALRTAGGAAYVRHITDMGGKAMFVARDDGNELELWVSDGTEANTLSLNSATTTNSYSSINDLTAVQLAGVGERLFFTAWDAAHGTELWMSDGTEAGTHLVKDIHSTQSGICHNNGFLTAFNNKLYFCGTNGTGDKLWVSDGTEPGTHVVTTGTWPQYPGDLLVVGDTLYFRALNNDLLNDAATHYELYKSDGSDIGTQLVKDINPISNSYPQNLTNVNGTLFFTADDGTGTYDAQNKIQIFKSDGTPEGTVKVTDTDQFYQGIAVPGGTTVTSLTAYNGTLYFVARDREYNLELWKLAANIPPVQPKKHFYVIPNPGGSAVIIQL